MTCASIKVVRGAYLQCTGDAGHADNHRFAVEWTTTEEYVAPPPPPTIEEQLERLRSKYPDAVMQPKKGGWFTVKYTIPLPKEKYNRDSTWVAFDVPPGFPASHPENFLTDPNLRLSWGGFLPRADYGVHPFTDLFGEPKRKWETFEASHDLNVQIVFGRVQMWNPNHDTLFTYAMVIKHAILGAVCRRES